jgi:acetyltransferase-like isoleucine patch superfamily enzyme
MKHTLIARLLGQVRRLGSACRIALARATGAEIGPDCVLAAGTDLYLGLQKPRAGRLVLGNACELAQGVALHPYGGSIVLGPRVYVGQHSVIFGHGDVVIGDDTLIAMHCRIVAANHTIPSPGVPINSRPDLPRPVRIGRDVWLGAGVTVLAGVTIGDGCVVGAGAVVTSDLPANSVCAGIPARVLRERL